jgi:hypothetical protein
VQRVRRIPIVCRPALQVDKACLQTDRWKAGPATSPAPRRSSSQSSLPRASEQESLSPNGSAPSHGCRGLTAGTHRVVDRGDQMIGCRRLQTISFAAV